MPMPDPTPGTYEGLGFLTPTRIAVVAIVALAAAIAALVIAMKASQQDRDKEDAKKGVGCHRVTVSELLAATYLPGDSSYRSASVSCDPTGVHNCA
jgi:hypothetical protein